MEHFYQSFTQARAREIRTKWMQRVERELRYFAEDLNDFLDELSVSPSRNWRSRLENFLAEQEVYGRVVKPEHRGELIAYLEAWAESIEWEPESGPLASETKSAARLAPIIQKVSEPEPAPATTTTPDPGPLGWAKRWWRGGEQREIFDREFARAKQQFDDIQRILNSLGGRLDAAKAQDEVDVDADVEAIEDRVWNFNDAFYRAREAWLAGDLSGDLLSSLYEMKTPGHFGLPWASNPGQAEQAISQGHRVHRRQLSRNAWWDFVVASAEGVELAGTAAGLALGGGVLITAAKKGGKWAVVKTIATAAASSAIEEKSDEALRAAGVSNEVIQGVKLAGAVVNFVILRKRVGASRGDAQTQAIAETDSLKGAPKSGELPESVPSKLDATPSQSASAPTRPPTAQPGLRFWSAWKAVNGRRVYQRNDLFDSAPETATGQRNLIRMAQGKAPLGRDGKPVALHHLTQQEPGSIAEVAGSFHEKYTRTLHGLVENRRSFRYSPSGRKTAAEKAFNRWSYKYWQDRAQEIAGNARTP